MKLVITRIDMDAIRQQRPTRVHVSIFDSLGSEQLKLVLPVSKFKGSLEVGQELILIPKDQYKI